MVVLHPTDGIDIRPPVVPPIASNSASAMHQHSNELTRSTHSNDVGAVDHIVAIVLSVNAISSDESTPEPPTACGPD